MVDVKAVLDAASHYLKRHPEEVLRVFRSAAGRRVGIPLDALRWFASQAGGKRAPKDVEIVAVPPGIGFGLTVELMGTPIRVSGVVYVEGVQLSAEAMRVELRLEDLGLKVLNDQLDTPIAALIKSGALDLSKPGNLVAYMPKRPAVLVDAKNDRIVLDLMRLPKLARSEHIGRILGVVTPLMSIERIETRDEHLELVLKPFPSGVSETLSSVRSAF
jgi:hypothetical protein